MSKPTELAIIYYSIEELRQDIEAMKADMEFFKPVTAENFIEMELRKIRIANMEAFPEKWIEDFHQSQIDMEIKNRMNWEDWNPQPINF
jgi:hypothetical protein